MRWGHRSRSRWEFLPLDPAVELGCPVWDPQAGPGEVVELKTTAFSPVCQERAPQFRAPDGIRDFGKTVLQAGGPAPSMGFTS